MVSSGCIHGKFRLYLVTKLHRLPNNGLINIGDDLGAGVAAILILLTMTVLRGGPHGREAGKLDRGLIGVLRTILRWLFGGVFPRRFI